MNPLSLFLAAAIGASAQTPTANVAALKDAEAKDPNFAMKVDATNEFLQVLASWPFNNRGRMGGWTITPSLRAGEFAPTGNFPAPMSAVTQSPYFGATLQVQKDGSVPMLGILDVSRAAINSRSLFNTPAIVSPTAANPALRAFHQAWTTVSGYFDVGKTFTFSNGVRAAAFAAVNGTQMWSGSGSLDQRPFGQWEAGAGGIARLPLGRRDSVALKAVYTLQNAPSNMFSNYDQTMTPVTLLGAEWRHPIGPGGVLKVGVETEGRRSDTAKRLYVATDQNKWSVQLGVEDSHSQNPFYPNQLSLAARIQRRISPSVKASFQALKAVQRYSGAGPYVDQQYMLNVEIAVGRGSSVNVGAVQRAQSPAPPFKAAAAVELNNKIPGPDYGLIFNQALLKSPTLADFVRNVPPHVLSAVSMMTSLFSDYNYNRNEAKVPNVQDLEQLYERGRRSYLTNTQDPTLVCIGAAQFAAVLARQVAAQNGQSMDAAAVTVQTAEHPNGQTGGHAVASIRTKEYGIVFAEWGHLTPTYTQNTSQALRLYQAIQGVPSVYHEITAGNDGHYVGYLFTDEGKAFLRQLTFRQQLPESTTQTLFNQPEKVASRTAERYTRLLDAPAGPWDTPSR